MTLLHQSYSFVYEEIVPLTSCKFELKWLKYLPRCLISKYFQFWFRKEILWFFSSTFFLKQCENDVEMIVDSPKKRKGMKIKCKASNGTRLVHFLNKPAVRTRRMAQFKLKIIDVINFRITGPSGQNQKIDE